MGERRRDPLGEGERFLRARQRPFGVARPVGRHGIGFEGVRGVPGAPRQQRGVDRGLGDVERLGDVPLHEVCERLEGEPTGDHRPLAGRAGHDEPPLEEGERVVDALEPERRRCDPLDEVDALDEPVVGQERERPLRFVEVDERLGDPALGAVGEAAEHRGHERGERVGPARHHRARQGASLRELAPPVVVERDLDEQRRDGRVLRLERLQRSHQERA